MANMSRSMSFDCAAMAALAMLCAGCESVDVESFDGDRRLRSWAAQEFDHEWANPAFPHVVRIDWADASLSRDCTGMLLAGVVRAAKIFTFPGDR